MSTSVTPHTGSGPDPSEAIEETLDLMRANGGRVTTSRRQLLWCLYQDSTHRTAEEIATEIQKTTPDVHLSTVYRNLEELERLGVVVHAHLGHGPATYHLATDTHGHLVCESCGTTLEAPERFFNGLSNAAARAYGFAIDPRHFAVLGRCAACQFDADPLADGPNE